MVDRVKWITDNSVRQPESEFKPGDCMVVCLEQKTISHFEPYTGPFDFVSRIARFTDGTGMSLEKGAYYRLFKPVVCR